MSCIQYKSGVKGMNILFQGDSITDCGRAKEQMQPNISLGDGMVFLIYVPTVMICILKI